ncbi:hypothetical protein BDZ89DRAFT_1036682 [Hymenopellis radicata]|nr:hypothetical protein BDZ89DRAFT_1036682 [Hymenopellis radicata]
MAELAGNHQRNFPDTQDTAEAERNRTDIQGDAPMNIASQSILHRTMIIGAVGARYDCVTKLYNAVTALHNGVTATHYRAVHGNGHGNGHGTTYRVDVYNDIAILWWCRVFENLEVSVIETLNLVVYIAGEDLTSFEPWEKLDGILSSWRFHSLKEFTLQFWVTPFKSSAERQNNGRVELSRLKFPEVSRKVKTHISVDSKPVPKFWLNSRYNE